MKYLMTISAAVLAFSLSAYAQTNDPLLNQQYYIGAHNIDKVWNTTTGSSNTRIAIHSETGFSNNHQDMNGTRYLNPFTNWYEPEKGYAQELAGIVGALTNNGTGMAGINWNAKLKSYNFVEVDAGGNDPNYVFDADNVDYHFDVQRINNMVDQAHNDNMAVQLFTFGVPTSSQSINADFLETNPSLTDYKTLTSGPSFPTPTEVFWDDFQSRLLDIGSAIWSSITSGNDYTAPNPFYVFRRKLHDAAVLDNSLLIAPVGDKLNGDNPVPILVPFAFDDYVIGVGGAEVSQTTGQRSYWAGGGASSYMDVVAAAKDITTLSGDSYSSYNNSFSSTQASAAIAAGVVSLIKTQNTALSYDDIEHILENTAVDIEGAGKDDLTGHGFLDAKAALDYINNNDFVRKTIQKSDIQTILNTEQPQEYIMDSDYDIYKHSSWATTTYSIKGKIGTYKGRVEFDYVFSNPPDVWLRNSSSGTEVNLTPYTVNYSIQYYDKFGSKSIKVLSIDEYGFTFEMEYWMAEFTNAYQTVGTVQIPDLDEIHIDYTAVGNETTTANPPFSAGIMGLWLFTPGDTGYWGANGSGGTSPYSFSWYRSYSGSSGPWSYVGSGSSYNQTVNQQMWLKLNGSDSGGQSDYDIMQVNITSCTSEPCPKPKAAPENDIDPVALPEIFSINQNYPNPFNPSTQLTYDLPEAADVTLKVYNIMGQDVATLVNTNMNAGSHEATFDAGSLSSGIYIARIRAVGTSGEVFTKELKMQLIK